MCFPSAAMFGAGGKYGQRCDAANTLQHPGDAHRGGATAVAALRCLGRAAAAAAHAAVAAVANQVRGGHRPLEHRERPESPSVAE